MALQITLPSPPPLRPTSSPSFSSSSSSSSASASSVPPLLSLPAARSAVAVADCSRVSAQRRRVPGDAARRVVLTRSGVETGSVMVGQVTEVNKDTFWPIVEAAAPKIVVLDMYTQRCGPCKVMAPKFQELSEKYLDVVFLKLDCNQENKSLAKELGIRVVPTFKILKEMKIVKEITGAKFDDLVYAIETARSS